MKKIKVAVAISSRLRNYNDVSLKSIVNYFDYKNESILLEVDYFVHLNRKKCNILNGKKNFSQDFITSHEEDMIKSILFPKKFVIEEGYNEIQNKIEKIKLDINPPEDWIINPSLNNDYQRLYPYHSQEESIKLIEDYENENNFKYDLIFKLRPDLYVEPNPHISRHLVFNFIENYRNMWNGINTSWAKTIDVDKSIVCLDIEVMNGHIRYSDFSFFGTSKSIKLYTYNFIYNYLEYYLYLNKQRNVGDIYADNYFTPESFITYPISKYKMNLHSLWFFKYVLIRKNYVENSNFDELVDLFYKHESEEFNKYKT